MTVDNTEDKESNEVRVKFSLFLKDFINRNALVHGILDHMGSILVRCTNQHYHYKSAESNHHCSLEQCMLCQCVGLHRPKLL